MVNDSGISVGSQAGGNNIWGDLHCVMMDLGAQSVMIDMMFLQELQLITNDLTSWVFTIVTSIGHIE